MFVMFSRKTTLRLLREFNIKDSKYYETLNICENAFKVNSKNWVFYLMLWVVFIVTWGSLNIEGVLGSVVSVVAGIILYIIRPTVNLKNEINYLNKVLRKETISSIKDYSLSKLENGKCRIKALDPMFGEVNTVLDIDYDGSDAEVSRYFYITKRFMIIGNMEVKKKEN